jgi:NAD(P)-dependent dehydrogenase (short-subunit alcohol dehydrogenase family)
MLEDKVAIVTGAAMGMGAATARVFAAAGARVIVSDINAELGQATAARIRADGGEASFVRTDVSTPAHAEASGLRGRTR